MKLTFRLMFCRINGAGITNDFYVTFLIHIFKRMLISFSLLFKLSFLETINEMCTEFVSLFREFAGSIVEFAI